MSIHSTFHARDGARSDLAVGHKMVIDYGDDDESVYDSIEAAEDNLEENAYCSGGDGIKVESNVERIYELDEMGKEVAEWDTEWFCRLIRRDTQQLHTRNDT
jgi:hypothetical protein